MKILNAIQLKEADAQTLVKQNITSAELMERAATQAFFWIKNKFADKETVFHIFCGKGNNGGDGLVLARLLHNDNYVVFLNIIGDGSPSADFSLNFERLGKEGIALQNSNEISSFGKGKTVVIDALFGIGFSRELNDDFIDIINIINNSGAFVIAVDTPSGLYLDKKTELAVKADVVLTFQCAKLAFYLPSNYNFTGKVVVLDIGLDKAAVDNVKTSYYLTDSIEVVKRYKPIPAFAHKGTLGHALIIGGSYGKVGAVCLSAKAALKSGCGLVTAFAPECGYNALQSYFPEAMVLTNGNKHIENIGFDISPDAIGIGPGLGQEQQTQEALYNFIKQQDKPLVIDADALNILSYNKEWLNLLPEGSILTPHPKELERLLGSCKDDYERLDKMIAFAAEYKIVLVAKNARTMIVYNNEVHINPTGNAALATGGSGDVLTGLITGLLAQGYSPQDAAVFGVYLHGLAADIAVPETGIQSFTASDIINYVGKAYLKIQSDMP
ncbi:NAD(P)H-hydrate dehydratase [Flavobacterium sp. MK4S-17]|uniref:NAD(P)H-hydrate dehydratase n=1 Tax=Flavobacterium sp. MK4S-17 TaxID=2543737 RepID=UPI001358363E|nr:NAD(P)H-hydrate dehydratase [Flavobacterium sp. MK4S-17]